MARCHSHFVTSDLRKFAEQPGDIIGWINPIEPTSSRTASGVDWSHYRLPLPEHVYDAYMRYWADATLK